MAEYGASPITQTLIEVVALRRDDLRIGASNHASQQSACHLRDFDWQLTVSQLLLWTVGALPQTWSIPDAHIYRSFLIAQRQSAVNFVKAVDSLTQQAWDNFRLFENTWSAK